MRILMVAIPNHHFFQWVNQLENAGFEVFWFDITDGGEKSNKITWVTQLKKWKLKWDFPFRTRLKKTFPKVYTFIEKHNQNSVSKVFHKVLKDVKPDVVHCFEMQLAGLPILPVMQQNNIPLIYSSWGSDVFYFKELGVSNHQLQDFYKRVNYVITDCKRDFNIMKSLGYKNEFLGVYPGNGGLTINQKAIKPIDERNSILIKGYDDGVGKATVVLKALEKIPLAVLSNKQIIIYSADDVIKTQVECSERLSKLNIKIHSRYQFIKNETLLELMGTAMIHIANSISDGMPNALLEAMAMGTFPIQSNPGQVTEEVITNHKNGFLIQNPLDENEISQQIITAIEEVKLRKEAQDFNVNYINNHYKRTTLQPRICEMYNTVIST